MYSGLLFINSAKQKWEHLTPRAAQNCLAGRGLESPGLVYQMALTKQVCFSSLIFLDWIKYEDNIYKVFQKKKDWIDAESHCVGWGGHLASISSLNEQIFIDRLLQNSPDNAVWIGLNDRQQEDRLEWTDGTSVVSSYQFWNSGEPNNGGEEDCVEITQNSGRWYFVNCAVQNWFACKKSNVKGITYLELLELYKTII